MNLRTRMMEGMAGCAILIAATSVAADGGESSSPGASLDDLASRIEQLEHDNAALRGEVDQLRAQTTDGWLTEQRATEIRKIVGDVLADADGRGSLQGSGMTAGWDPQAGYFLASSDGRFKLQFNGLMQIRWAYNYHDEQDQHRQGFENTRTELTWRGYIFSPDISYLVRGLFSREGGGAAAATSDVVGGEFRLEDAWIRWAFNDHWSLRLGQFRLPFNREELVAHQYQMAAEHSLVNESQNLGRSQGVELQYLTRDFRFLASYNEGGDDSLGQAGTLAGTSPPNTPFLDRDTEYSFTARNEHLFAGEWGQFEDFTSPPADEFGLMFGYALHYQQGESDGSLTLNRNENRWFAADLDVSAEFGGATLFAQVMYDYADSGGIGCFNIYSGLVQGSVYISDKAELFARFEYGRLSTNREDIHFPDLRLITVGVNYYFQGHDLKWTTDFGMAFQRVAQIWATDNAGWRTDQTNGAPQAVFRTQIQLLF